MARVFKELFPNLLASDPNSAPRFLDNVSGDVTIVLSGIFDGAFKAQYAYDERGAGKWTDVTAAAVTGSQPTHAETVKDLPVRTRLMRLVTTTNITNNSTTVPARCMAIYDEV